MYEGIGPRVQYLVVIVLLAVVVVMYHNPSRIIHPETKRYVRSINCLIRARQQLVVMTYFIVRFDGAQS